MSNFIIESEMRVGSRWVHYLLADLYGMKPSPEVEGRKLIMDRVNQLKKMDGYFATERIPKIHHIHVPDLFHIVYPWGVKVLTIVRNPRDRAVSIAFHHKNDPGKARWPQRGMSDKEAVRYTVLEYDNYNISNVRMISNMMGGHSTRSGNDVRSAPHLWVAYEWLLENPVGEFKVIDEFINREKVMTVEQAVDKHSFENKTKRKQGEEKRTDVWRRKGVNKDWENWFDKDLIDATQHYHELYKVKLAHK